MSATHRNPPPGTPGRILAIANQKGGVGKTTTAINLATALALGGQQVLLVDLDPQGNASTGLGVDRFHRNSGTYAALVHGTDPAMLRQSTLVPSLDIIPADPDLAGAEIELVGIERREFRLRESLRDPGLASYTTIIIDCPPSLGLLTLNGLVAADAVLVPLQCEFFALEGISQLVRTIEWVNRGLNPGLTLQGIVLTMFDRRNNLSDLVAADARSFFGDRVYDTVIPRNIRVSEAPSHGKPVLLYDKSSAGALAYVRLAEELLLRQPESRRMTTNPRLGRGLAALMGDTSSPPPPSHERPRTLPVTAIEPGPFQPRTNFAEDAMADLVQSIQTHGILQPLLVRPHPNATGKDHYQIVAGERRWRAAQLAGLHEVPVLIRAIADSDAMEAALVENLQRQDLDPIEEAEGFRRLQDEFNLTQEKLAIAVGKSRSHVANSTRLLSLPLAVRAQIQKGALTAGHARALLTHPNPEEAANLVIARGLNVRQTEALTSVKTAPAAQIRDRPQRPGNRRARARPIRTPGPSRPNHVRRPRRRGDSEICQP